MNQSAKIQNDTTVELKFRTLALRYQEIARESGVKLRPFRSPDMPLWAKATPEARKVATDFLETIVSIHEETIAAKETPINSRQLLWRALGRLSLVPDSGIFDRITNEDVVVVYNDVQTAVFWNLQFFNFSSFTVEDMFFGVWHQMTKRDPAVHETLYKMAVNIITGKITGIFHPPVGPHTVEELDSLECTKTIMEIPCGSVLTTKGKFSGMLIIQKMKIIG